MKRSLKVAVAAVSMALACAASAKEWQTIRVGIDPTYPPFESLSTSGDVVGFDVDLGNALCAKLKAKCVWVQSSFDGLIPGLQARKFDVIHVVHGRYAEAPRADPFHQSPVSQPDAPDRAKFRALLPDAAKLGHKRVAVQQGTVQETYAREKWAAAGVEVVPYQNYDQAYADLGAGRVDAVLMDAVQGKLGFLDTPSGKGFAFAGDVVYDPKIMGDGDAAGMRKSDSDLRDALNVAIAEMLRDGTYRKIERKYFPFDMYGK